MNSVILLLSLICSLASSAVLRQGGDKPTILARVLNDYLAASPRRKPILEMEIDSIFYTSNDFLPQADTWDNIGLVLRTGNQGWIRSFVNYDSGPLRMKKIYSNPPETGIDGQVFGDLYSSHMLYFSLGLGVNASNRIILPPVWPKFMYKAVRGLNTDQESDGIARCINEFPDAQVAVGILIDDTLHMWRKGAGAFLVIGTTGQGTIESVIFPKRHHNVSFGLPCPLTYSTVKLRANDVVFFVQTPGDGGNREIVSSTSFVDVCKQNSRNPAELKRLIGELVDDIYQEHGKFRLDAFHIQRYRR